MDERLLDKVHDDLGSQRSIEITTEHYHGRQHIKVVTWWLWYTTRYYAKFPIIRLNRRAFERSHFCQSAPAFSYD